MDETKMTAGETPDGNGGQTSENGELFTREQVDALLSEQSAAFGARLAETERLCAMNKDEKAAYRREKLQKELDAREAALLKRELRAAAVEKLSERKLPAALIPCINLSSAESLEESLDAVAECFSKTLREEIGARVHLGAPKGAPYSGADAFLEGLGIRAEK